MTYTGSPDGDVTSDAGAGGDASGAPISDISCTHPDTTAAISTADNTDIVVLSFMLFILLYSMGFNHDFE